MRVNDSSYEIPPVMERASHTMEKEERRAKLSSPLMRKDIRYVIILRGFWAGIQN